MKTLYPGRDGPLRTATYSCRRVDGWGTTIHRVTVPARFIDAEVVHHVLEALTAIDHEMARAVIEKSQLEHATEQRARARQRLDGQEDVDRLRRAVVNMPVLRQNLGRRASR